MPRMPIRSVEQIIEEIAEQQEYETAQMQEECNYQMSLHRPEREEELS